MKKLICFPDPIKVYGLMGKRANTIHYSGNTNQILYIYRDGTRDLCDEDTEKNEKACIIIVPQGTPYTYIPEGPFKLLVHERTPPEKKQLNLRDNCVGYRDEHATGGTTWEDLINAIFSERFQDSFELVYEKIGRINHKLSSVLDYLQDCLIENQISTDTSRMSGFGIDVTITSNSNMDDFSNIRDNLLSQCSFEPEND